MRIRIPVICIFLLILFSGHVYAAEDTYYIFQINQPIEDECILARVEPVYEAAGIYRTNDFSIIQDFALERVLLAYTLDTDISLFGLQEDIEVLQDGNWSRAMLGVDYASSHGLYGSGIRIALIDSGIRADFSELTGATVAQGINYLALADSEERTDTSDSVGHGTFVASIIASDSIGLAPQAELIPLKCFDAEKSSVSYVMSAIYAAVDDYQCDIINLSLGTTVNNPFLKAAVSYAYENGVIMVASSGNLDSGKTSTGNDAYYYPAAYDEVIGVGAVDASKGIASFSVQNQSVWVTAPGDGVTGLSRTGTRYKTGSGTSYASPYVTAAAALAKDADSTLTPEQIMEFLRLTAEDAGDDGFDNAYGYGVLNIGLLLAEVRNDSESLILSLCGDTLCVSSYQSDLEADFQLILAFYESGSRFAGASFIMDGTEGYMLNNYVLPSDPMPFAIFTVGRETFAPLTAAKKYL